MKKYGMFMILVGYLLVGVSVFMPLEFVYISQIVLVLYSFSFYVMYGRDSKEFLNHFKYVLISFVFVYLFIQRYKGGEPFSVKDLNTFIADLMMFIQSVLLVFILLKVDRMISIEKIEQTELT